MSSPPRSFSFQSPGTMNFTAPFTRAYRCLATGLVAAARVVEGRDGRRSAASGQALGEDVVILVPRREVAFEDMGDDAADIRQRVLAPGHHHAAEDQSLAQ